MQAFARNLYRDISNAQSSMHEHTKLRLKNASKEEVLTMSFAELPHLIRDNVFSNTPSIYAPISILQRDKISSNVTRVTRVIPESTTRIDVFFLTGTHCAKQVNYQYTLDIIEMYVRVLESMSPLKHRRQSVEIVLLPTLFKKQMDMNEPAILGPIHVNSGITIKGAFNSAICVYRHEEQYKVLLHELMHLYNFDYFETANAFDTTKFKRKYNIESKRLGLNESFNDALTLAVYLGFFIAVKEPQYMSSFKDFYRAYHVHFNHLKSYLVKMSAKLRLYQERHFGKGAQRENTHVFAYYHGKAALFVNSRSLFLFFKKYDNHVEESTISFRTYIRLLKGSLNSKVYKAFIALHMEQLPTTASDFFYRTLRMCNFDLEKIDK